jgi:ribosomal protein S18 acetylase RimI-like enzyme
MHSHPGQLPPGIPDAPQLQWRALGHELAESWFALHNAVRRADQRAEYLSETDLHDELSASWLDLERDTRIGFDSSGVARAFGVVELRPGDVTLLRANAWGGVHPEWRGRGIGRAVLDWQRRRAAEQVTARRGDLGPDTRAILRADAPDGAAATEALFTRMGLVKVRVSLGMRRELEKPIGRIAPPDGLALVPYEASMDEQVRTAHNTFFAGHFGFQPWSQETWRQWATGHRAFRPDWSFVVLARSEIIGYIICAAYPDEWAAQGWTQGFITKVGTAPAWRGRGVAPALIMRAMTAFAADGMQYAGLDVDADNPSGAPRLYRRLVFEEWHRLGLWEMPL